ncbi:MAG: hypothetical protein DRJ45_06245 [Thermoprotei archaeon]|nr:MAG: hypothetical protein DRJ45_06245 [Thermoprotei archaeon]
MGNLKYLGTTYDNEKRKLWVKIRNDGSLTEARTKVEFYLEGGYQGGYQKDVKVDEGQTVEAEFDYPPADVDSAKIDITDARTEAHIGTWTVELKEVEVKYTLSGYVKDTEGNQIDYATVDAFGIETKTTAANGYYQFEFDQGYSGEVTASKPGYKSQTKTITLAEGINNLDFELEKETPSPPPEKHNRIYGVVKGPLGEPVQYATVTFGGKTAVTNSAGEYEILDVWYSGEIVCQAPGYETASQIIEAPLEGDLEVNFTLSQKPKEAPEIDVTPLISPLQGVDAKLQTFPTATELAKQQLQTQRVQGELDETLLATALRQVGLDDWADKYEEIYSWLTENFGVSYVDPITGEEKKMIILAAGFTASLEGLASKLGLSTARSALARAGGAIAAALGGLKASTLIKGITGVMGTVIFAEFIAEEAVQTAGMGVYQAMQTRNAEVIRQAIESYKNILNACKTIHEHVKYLDPIGASFDAFFEAAENNITNYEKALAYYEEKENYGKLRITSKPSYAEIWIDDEFSGYLTPETLKIPVGVYKITIRAEGYHDKVFEHVEIEADKTTELRAELERMKIGYLTIRSRPSQAAIYINGVDTKLLTPQTFELEEGKYTITLKYHGYKDKEFEVEIKEGETVEKFLRLTRE